MLSDPIKWESPGSQSPGFSAPDLLLSSVSSWDIFMIPDFSTRQKLERNPLRSKVRNPTLPKKKALCDKDTGFDFELCKGYSACVWRLGSWLSGLPQVRGCEETPPSPPTLFYLPVIKMDEWCHLFGRSSWTLQRDAYADPGRVYGT